MASGKLGKRTKRKLTGKARAKESYRLARQAKKEIRYNAN